MINLFLFLLIAKAGLIQSPKDCLQSTNTKCALWNKSEIGKIVKEENYEIYLQKEAIATVNEKTIDLISGAFFITSSAEVQIDTSYGHLICHACSVHVKIEKNRLFVQSAEGSLQVKSIDEEAYIGFPVGFRTVIYPVDALSGKSKREVFQVFDLEEVLAFFANFEEAAVLTAKWESRRNFFIEKAKEASQFYKIDAERQMAAENEKKVRAAARLEVEAKERARLRKMFREKNYLE